MKNVNPVAIIILEDLIEKKSLIPFLSSRLLILRRDQAF